MPDLSSAQGFNEQSLPRRGKSKSLKLYRDRLEYAKKWRENEGLDDTWRRLRDVYRLRMFDQFAPQDRIAVAVGFATVNVIAPSVAVNQPKIVVYPTIEDPDHSSKAAIAEGVMNYWWRRYDFKKPIRQAVKDSLVYGTGICKVGWRYETRELERDEQDMALEAAALADQYNEQAAQEPATAGDLPSDQEIVDGLDTKEEVIVSDRPFVERVSPFDLYVDPEATCVEDLRWVAQKTVRALAEVKVDERYKPSARRKVKADAIVAGPDDPSVFERQRAPIEQQEDGDRVIIWEFYDLVRNEMCVFAAHGDGFLVDPVEMPYPFGAPFVFLPNYEVPDYFWCLGDLEAIEPLQYELNETRSMMVMARQLDIPKFFYRRDSLDDDAIEGLRSKTAWMGVPVEGDMPFEQLVAPVPRPTPSPQLYQHSDQIEADIALVSGVSEYARGEMPETRRTATEASIIQDAANSRAADKLAQVEEFISQIARRVLQLGQEYMTGEQAARATGNGNAMVLWSFTADDIQGEFDFEVEAGSTRPRNDTFRRQQAMQMANVLAPFVGTVINPFTLVSHILTDGYGIKDPSPYLLNMPLPSPDQMASPEDPAAQGGEQPPPDEGQSQSSAGAQANQLAGQVGLELMNTPNGGGALGPGGA